jgi:hypothetical protein
MPEKRSAARRPDFWDKHGLTPVSFDECIRKVTHFALDPKAVVYECGHSDEIVWDAPPVGERKFCRQCFVDAAYEACIGEAP